MTELSQHKVGSANAGIAYKAKTRWGDVLAPYLFITPFLISFVVIFLIPAAYSLGLSFYRYKGYGTATFVGIDNYVALLKFSSFWPAVRNTIIYWLGHVVPLMAIAFALALLIRSKIVRWKNFWKPLIFLPNIVAVVASALVFQSFFGTQYGVLNTLFNTKIPWLQDNNLTLLVVIILIVWRSAGWWFVIFLAGLTSINPEIEEAALVDGATFWQKTRFITVPLMRNTFLFAFVIDAVGSFRLFTEPNVLINRMGGLARWEIAPFLNLMVSELRAGRFGPSSAAGWILFIMLVGVTIVQFRLFKGSEGVEE